MGGSVSRYRAWSRTPLRRRHRSRAVVEPPCSSAGPLKHVLELSQQGIGAYDRHQRLVFFNDRYAEIYGFDPSQLRTGMTLREVIDLRYAAGTGPKMTPAEYRAWLLRLVQTERSTELEMVMSNGSVYSLHHQPLPDGGFIGFFTDVTGRHLAERRIQHMAHHDALTGVPNRVQFFEHLDRSILWLRGDDRLEHQRPPVTMSDRLLAVMFLDLDKFKDINDTLGHAVGDELLQHVAQRIRGCLREPDLLARLGGDEFAIVLDRGIVDIAQVRAVAERVISAISRPFALMNHEVVVGVTIGFTTTDCYTTANSAVLLSQADLALYAAKALQRGTCSVFEPGMDLAVARRTELERDLRRAIADESLEVHFQPMFRLSPLRIVGAEALLRWEHPRYGSVSPSEFIPLAEATSMITALGKWVLRQACARAAGWGEITVAVNLSPEQVRQPDLVDMVERILLDTGVPPHRLELEITEGMLLHDTVATAEKLNRLRALGIGIALDDFGTGYSSLSYLRRFPFSKLKIDRSFIETMSSDAGTASIVRAIASLGQSLEMLVIAEGIETEAQLEQVRTAGCNEAQGFLLGRPCPPEALERMLAEQGSP